MRQLHAKCVKIARKNGIADETGFLEKKYEKYELFLEWTAFGIRPRRAGYRERDFFQGCTVGVCGLMSALAPSSRGSGRRAGHELHAAHCISDRYGRRRRAPTGW